MVEIITGKFPFFFIWWADTPIKSKKLALTKITLSYRFIAYIVHNLSPVNMLKVRAWNFFSREFYTSWCPTAEDYNVATENMREM